MLYYFFWGEIKLPRDVLLSAFPSLINHLLMPNYVLQTYAAITVERLLFLKKDGQSV
jgi:exportin-2 (importin alpha re-exporter)